MNIIKSKGIKTWSIIKGPTSCRLMFTEKVRRVDIRFLDKGKFTKNGVSLTPSELEFCLDFVSKFKESPSEATFYNLTIEKDGKSAIRLMKHDKPYVITDLSFWKILEPIIPAIAYIIRNVDFSVYELLDLFLLSTMMPQKELLKRKWPDNVTDYNPSKSFLHHLGLFDSEIPKTRKIDTASLNRFLIDESNLFDSLVKFMYI